MAHRRKSRRPNPRPCINQPKPTCQSIETCHDQPVVKSNNRNCAEDDHCRQDETRCADLRHRFLALLDSAPSETLWKEIWTLFVSHQWVHIRLERCARTALRGSYMSEQWLDDVKQDVYVRLAGKLQRSLDLNLDRAKAEVHFAGWLNTILLRDCQMAVRQLRRLYCRTLPLLEDRTGADPTTSIDARIDFNRALDRLDDAESSVMVLYAQGYTIREIAAAVGFSNSKAYRLIRQASAHMEKGLGASECAAS